MDNMVWGLTGIKIMYGLLNFHVQCIHIRDMILAISYMYVGWPICRGWKCMDQHALYLGGVVVIGK